MDLAEYRKVSRVAWDRMAAGWDSRRQWIWEVSHAVGEHMVAKLDPQPGDTVLELAAGTGETGFAAAERVGPRGRLISTDFAASMVEAARRRSAELGLQNVECEVMDAEHMHLDDDSVDGVLCRWGYMLMADPAAALTETRRVLRDGGRVCLSVWGPADENPWGSIPRATLVEAGHMPVAQPGDPGVFSMAAEERIRELLTGAGFGSIEIERVEVEWRFESFDDYWQFLYEVAGGLAITLEKLTAEEQARVRAAMEQRAEPWRSNGALALPGVALNACAS